MSIRSIIHTFLQFLHHKIGGSMFTILFGNMLQRDSIIEFLDGVLDFLEAHAQTTETPIDDKIIKAIRDALQIPDDD
jgi:hypothetical protein